MGYLQYATLNSLVEFSFIAGTEFKLEFFVYESDGITPVDLGGATIKWVLCPYGQPDYAILEINGAITDTNKFEVEILSTLSQTLSGKYLQQPVLIDFDGVEYRPAQGVITILPRIPITA